MYEGNHVEALRNRLAATWPNLDKARVEACEKLSVLNAALAEFKVPDTAIVSFGSLARLEFTSGSDIDWTLLLDGPASPEHLDTSLAIAKKLAELENKPPGREGTFGSLASSHDLVHHIGGEDDTNANTTRRSLLLLESTALVNSPIHERVLASLLKRYLKEDDSLWRPTNQTKIPHFLLNDFARYWRTMTVDFAYKQRSRANEGFAIRNMKLRMSRKLIYMAGMLGCFKAHLNGYTEMSLDDYDTDHLLPAVEMMSETFRMPPLEILAAQLIRHEALYPATQELFSSYDLFVGLLADNEKRSRLSTLKRNEADTDPTYIEARDITHRFRDAIQAIFLTPTSPIGELAIRYGVF